MVVGEGGTRAACPLPRRGLTMRNTNPLARRARLQVEPLEGRDAPATLVSPTTVTYQDADGDQVRVVFSRPVLTPANVNAVLTFNAGKVDGKNAGRQQLQRMDLTVVGPAAAGSALSVTAVRPPGGTGDGLAAVGYIDAVGIDLDTV